MQISIIHVLISMLLFFILFFGIGFILNMILRLTWIMAVIYPVVVLFIVNPVPWREYVSNPGASLQQLWEDVLLLAPADILILFSGFVGSIASGIVMRMLRQRGYRMF